jgi:serine/threonine protein kinase
MELQLTAARLRLDKKCGKSGIAANKKCGKSVAPASSSGGIITPRTTTAAVATGVVLVGVLNRRRWTPAIERAFKEAIALSTPQNLPKGSKFLAKGYAGAIHVSPDRKSVFKTNFKKTLVGRRQFLREVTLQAKLHDKGINTPNVLAVDSARSITQIEYMDGYKNLAKIVESGTKQEKARYAKQFVLEMSKLHKAGYAHGDMHLGNVMVKDGDVKLIDWGYAKPIKFMPTSGLRNDMDHINYMLNKLDPIEHRKFSDLIKETGLTKNAPTQQAYNKFWDRYLGNAPRLTRRVGNRLR